MNNLPETLDPSILAIQQADFKGNIEIKAFLRLSRLLASTLGEVQVQLIFRQDENKRSYIGIKIETQLQLICQRCSEPVSCDINVEQKISPVLTDAEAATVPKEYDPWVTHHKPIPLVDLIEEELLLSLPMVAKHEQGLCPVKLKQVFS